MLAPGIFSDQLNIRVLDLGDNKLQTIAGKTLFNRQLFSDNKKKNIRLDPSLSNKTKNIFNFYFIIRGKFSIIR